MKKKNEKVQEIEDKLKDSLKKGKEGVQKLAKVSNEGEKVLGQKLGEYRGLVVLGAILLALVALAQISPILSGIVVLLFGLSFLDEKGKQGKLLDKILSKKGKKQKTASEAKELEKEPNGPADNEE